MYKKIMFLIITLSIIINVGNSTVVMAKENIVTEIVDFPVTINYEEYNVDDYNANDMISSGLFEALPKCQFFPISKEPTTGRIYFSR